MSDTGGRNISRDAAGVVHVGAGLGVGDAVLLWEEADPNAEALLLGLPAADGTVVPVWIIGLKSLVGVDLGIFNGITSPTLVMFNATGTGYFKLAANDAPGVHSLTTAGYFRIDADVLQIASHLSFSDNKYMYIGSSLTGLAFYHTTTGDYSTSLSGAANSPIIITSRGNSTSGYSKGTAEPNPRLYITSATAFGVAVDEYLRAMHDTNDVLLSSGKGKMRIVSDEHNGASTNFGWASATVAAAAGATLTLAGLIPAKKTLIGISTRIKTALGATGGITGFTVGDGVIANRWGTQTAITLNAITTNDDAEENPGDWFKAAKDVTLTAVAGNFDGTGAIEVVAHYIDISAPTS